MGASPATDVDPDIHTGGTALNLGSGIADLFVLWNLSPDDYELAQRALADAATQRRQDREALADEVVGLLVGARRSLD